MSKVRVLQQEGLSAVVTYPGERGVPVRVVVPSDAIVNGEVDDEILQAAPTDGLDFRTIAHETSKKHFSHPSIGEATADALAKLGIWTADDLFQKRREARMAVTAIFNQFFAHFYNAALTAPQEDESDD